MRLLSSVSIWAMLLGLILVGCGRDVATPLLEAAVPPATTPAASSTPFATPTPAYPGLYAGPPTPDPTRSGGSARSVPEAYVVRPGDTLTGIAWAFDCTVDEIVRANNLANANAIWVGQRLTIPVMPVLTGPALKLIPDSELVYSPALIHFSVVDFVSEQSGYLAGYSESVEGQRVSGAEIVQAVARRYSVGSRVLLALLEWRAGWVTNPDPIPETLDYPMGKVEYRRRGLFAQLEWTAAELNAGYYAWRRADGVSARLANGQRVAFAPGLNAGTVGVQNYLAAVSDWPQWQQAVGPEGFLDTYRRLFGDPFAYSVEPLIPDDLTQPQMWLPWPAGEIWYLTGGPHEGWGRGSAWAALDFVPPDMAGGCTPSRHWVTAAAGGLVLRSENGQVVVDLDGDGYEQSGWVLSYLHVAAEGRVPAGAWLEPGQRIGHPSCEGGFADATHIHVARRFNGEWVPAGAGPAPFVLSGWTAQEGSFAYDGALNKDDITRTACECMLDDYNGFISDNVVPSE